MDISQLLQLLKTTGSVKALNKTFDFCGKFLGVSNPKSIEKSGWRHDVSEAEFVDAKGGKVIVSVWDHAISTLQSLTAGAGVAVVGCNATVAEAEVKLNIWPGAHICTIGAQAQSLTSLDASTLHTETLTATFTPGLNVLATMEEVAHPTCAAALADAVVDQSVTFQINRCFLDAPLQEELLLTQIIVFSLRAAAFGIALGAWTLTSWPALSLRFTAARRKSSSGRSLALSL